MSRVRGPRVVGGEIVEAFIRKSLSVVPILVRFERTRCVKIRQGYKGSLSREAMFCGPACGGRAVFHGKFAEQVSDMCLGGEGTYEELIADLSVRASVRNQFQHLEFAGGQLVRLARLISLLSTSLGCRPRKVRWPNPIG